MRRTQLLSFTGDNARALLCATLLFFLCACAGLSRPPETGRPRPNEPPYPVTLASSDERRTQALAAWTRLVGETNLRNASAPELQPVTATIRSLPATAGSAEALPLYLPKVGEEVAGRLPTEEETRESLRRFIADARPLLGVAPESLSLVEQTEANGIRTAVYEQKPFSHPLRGGYGVVRISFTADRRLVGLSSTAIPDTERIERALAAVRTQLAPADVAARLTGRAVTLTDADGAQRTVTIPQGDEKMVRDLVVYPTRSSAETATLDFHLAWEVATGDPQMDVVYVDAATGELIAATPPGGSTQR